MSEIIVAIFIFISTALIIFLTNKKVLLKLPPGPKGLPLVGYLPFLNSKAPYETLSNLVDSYGPIYSIRLGSILGIVLADPDIIRKVLSMEQTTGRAPLYLTHGIMKGYGLICSEGELWRDHRKFVLGFMRKNGMKNNLRHDQLRIKMERAVDEFIQSVSECSDSGIDVSASLLHCIGNVMNLLVFGVTYLEEDPKWKWLRSLLNEGVKLIGIAGPLNFLPGLRFVPKFRRVIQYIKENQIKTHLEYKKILDSMKEKLETNSTSDHPEDQNCLMEDYIQKRKSLASDEQLWHVAADMFGSGTETTMTTLSWHLLHMALYPDIQEEIREELNKAEDIYLEIISTSPVSEIALCKASLMETMRLRSIIPVGIPHGVTEDFEVEGYAFPKGSMVLPLLWRVHRDHHIWKDPTSFNPKRFLDADHQLIKHPSFMPFQTGRRVCIGEDFGKMLSLTFTSKILRQYRISLPKNSSTNDPTADPICGISLTPRPHKLIFTPI